MAEFEESRQEHGARHLMPAFPIVKLERELVVKTGSMRCRGAAGLGIWANQSASEVVLAKGALEVTVPKGVGVQPVNTAMEEIKKLRIDAGDTITVRVTGRDAPWVMARIAHLIGRTQYSRTAEQMQSDYEDEEIARETLPQHSPPWDGHPPICTRQ
jgi:phosphotransferase system HPr-like phosphotransfer protein